MSRIAVLALMLVLTVAALAARPAPSSAIALFSQQYGVSCAKCHSVTPHLNVFGAAFMANGDRIPGLQPGSAFPISAKANMVASSDEQGDGPNGAGLPKAIVDEVELFTSGAIGSRATYLVEQYVIDGGMPGVTRDAWISDRVNPWSARIPVFVAGGSFTLPLPVEPESLRDSYAGYALYEQTVGTNPFNFFDPKIGARLSVGNALRGLNLQLFAGPGHDRSSGLPTTGTDSMGFLQDTLGPVTLSAYRYAGTRPASIGKNSFSRTGFGVVFDQWGRLSSETVLQTGWDSNCLDIGSGGCASSGGFTQLRYQFNRRLYAAARYEGTQDPTNGFTRDFVPLVGYAPTERSRITLEDVIAHTPATTHTINFQLTIAY